MTTPQRRSSGEAYGETGEETGAPARVFRPPKSKKPLVVALAVLILILLVSTKLARQRTRYEGSVANREKVVVLTPGPKIIQTPPSGWEPTSGPGKGGQPQKPPQSVRKLGASRATPSAPPTPEAAPDVRVQKAESNCMCPMCLAARRFGDPEAEAHKSESKAETPAAKSFKLSPIRVVQRGPDGITRQIPVHAAPDGIAAELSRTEQALEPSSRTKRPE